MSESDTLAVVWICAGLAFVLVCVSIWWAFFRKPSEDKSCKSPESWAEEGFAAVRAHAKQRFNGRDGTRGNTSRGNGIRSNGNRSHGTRKNNTRGNRTRGPPDASTQIELGSLPPASLAAASTNPFSTSSFFAAQFHASNSSLVNPTRKQASRSHALAKLEGRSLTKHPNVSIHNPKPHHSHLPPVKIPVYHPSAIPVDFGKWMPSANSETVSVLSASESPEAGKPDANAVSPQVEEPRFDFAAEVWEYGEDGLPRLRERKDLCPYPLFHGNHDGTVAVEEQTRSRFPGPGVGEVGMPDAHELQVVARWERKEREVRNARQTSGFWQGYLERVRDEEE